MKLSGMNGDPKMSERFVAGVVQLWVLEMAAVIVRKKVTPPPLPARAA